MRENATASGEWCGVVGQRLAPRGRMAGSWALYLKLELDAETSIQELGRERPDDDPHAG